MPGKPDIDAQETQEWLDALEAVLENEGVDRAHFLLERLIDKARRSGAYLPYSANTAYLNTIPLTRQPRFPGERATERRIRSFIRWNAMAMVVQANRLSTELGGHISSFASAATLFDVGFNHFFRARNDAALGDLVFFQGHSAPGIYARAYLEGRISEDQLYSFRQEVDGKGLPSYPHPRLMPGFWQFPTVSMGLGPIMAIYQARFMRYLQDRGLLENQDRRVWAFMGDGEMDEPESLGAISLAARERLDNLVFVVNCNLQRLDGPVRGNGKIIQELEAVFRGAGWNVIKVIWGGYWDPLLARDRHGLLLKRMEECVDGDYQAYKAKGGQYTREHFFGKYPQLADLVATMTDEDIWRLNRGGHDPIKVYSAYYAATQHKGQPTVILAKTVKGYGMGVAGEGQNITHSQKKMGEAALKAFRDRFNIPIPDDQIASTPVLPPARGQPGDAVSPRAPAGARRLPAGAGDDRASAQDPAPRELQGPARGQHRARDVHDHGLRALPEPAHARQGRGQAGRAHRAGRGAHLRHGGHVPPARDLLVGGPALYAGRLRPGDVLPRGKAGPDPPGGHQRGWRDVVVDRRGDGVRQPRCRDDPLLRLLLDVRVPAGRRPRLGGGRHDGARLPDRRHGRPDHAGGRRAAAPGRPQPPGRGDHPQLRQLRPDLRLRAGGHPA